MAPGQERHLDELYGAPLADFTRVRDRLAAQLRDAGHRAEAAEVKRLRKPSVVVWATNQLARRDAAGIERFIEAVNRLKRAPLKGAGAVGEATSSQRAALNALLGRAGGVMEASGMKLSPTTTRRISDTLLGAAADRRLQSDLRRGRLTDEQKAPGFEVLQGTRLRAVPAATKGGEHPARQPKAKSESEDKKRREQARRAANAEAQRKARRALQLDRLADRHRRAADVAATKAEALRRELHVLEQKVAAERAAADKAAREGERLRDEVKRK